jgi:Ni/Fe-hydrogenase subunit HybB-like protein
MHKYCARLAAGGPGQAGKTTSLGDWIMEKLCLGMPLRAYLRTLVTPFNAVAAMILGLGLPVMVYRFVFGLGAATNLSQTTPWGIWIGIDVLSGVALAAGGYTIAAAVYIFGLKHYYPVLRPAVLTGFLGYLFVVLGLLMDLGRPWRLPYPILHPLGVSSVMFEVAWCVTLYSTVLALEFSPMLFQWLRLQAPVKFIRSIIIPLVVAAVMLSTLHQSSLGALFLLAPAKLHPLWYSPFIPMYFFISSIIAGLTMVIVESALSHRIFRHQLVTEPQVDLDGLTLGLGKAAAVLLFAYFFMKLIGVADGHHWHLLMTPFGGWFLVELIGFTLLPCFLFAWGVRQRSAKLVRFTAVLAVIGIVMNRLNVSVIALNWHVAEQYVPSWMELVTTLTIITLGILTFRWIVHRMPVLHEHPEH